MGRLSSRMAAMRASGLGCARARSTGHRRRVTRDEMMSRWCRAADTRSQLPRNGSAWLGLFLALPLRSGAQTGGGRDHRRPSGVDGVDDLGVVDPLQIDRGDPEMCMPELALDNDQRYTLVSQLDRMRMAKLMWREATPDPRCGGSPAPVGGARTPAPSRVRRSGRGSRRTASRPATGRAAVPGLELLPRPAVHPDLATPVAFAVADKH